MVRDEEAEVGAFEKSASGAGVYVYGIIHAAALEGRDPLSSPSIGGKGDRIRAVRSGDLAALVSDSPEARYDVSRVNLLTHQRVLEEILAFTEVIPAQFGLVSASDERIGKQLLHDRHGELLAILAHIRGRVELGLKVFWKRENVFAEIVDGREDIRAMRDEIAAGAGHFDQIRLGQMVEKAMADLRASDADEILEALEPLCVELKTNALLTDMMVLNAAFLVAKEREALFDEAVNAIAERNGERLILKYAGPLPPFDFINRTLEQLSSEGET